MAESGQYRILGALGRGAFGTVYRAEKLGESGLSKTVALKVLNPEMSKKPEVAERLRDEARMLGLLRHRAILQVDGLVRLGERWAVVMEYVEGVDLKDLILAGPVPVGPALEIVGECAGALHVAYTSSGPEGNPLRLLHRDIKPSNVFVTSAGEVKILDFGVARADFGAREAETQQLRYGSVGYMSPERLDFIDTPAGDVYALGVVLWELLTAQVFGKSSSKEIRHQNRLKENLDILWEVTGGESQELIEFVESLLSYEPEDRPLARDVERQCGALRMKHGGPLLRDWSEITVGPLIEAKRNPTDEDPNSPTMVIGSGSNQSVADILEELDLDPDSEHGATQLGGQAAMSKWMPPTQDFYAPRGAGATELELGELEGTKGAPRRRPWWLIPGALAAGLLMLGVGTWWSLTAPGRGPAPRAVPALTIPPPAPQAAPVQPVTTPEAPAEQPAAEPEAAPAEAAKPEAEAPSKAEQTAPPMTEAAPAEKKSEPADRRTKTAEPKETTPSTSKSSRSATKSSSTTKTGVVSLAGDALKVTLISSGGKRRKASGSVPAGSYTIEATFPDADPINAGTVQVSPGAGVVIKCSSRFRRCTTKAQ